MHSLVGGAGIKGEKLLTISGLLGPFDLPIRATHYCKANTHLVS